MGFFDWNKDPQYGPEDEEFLKNRRGRKMLYYVAGGYLIITGYRLFRLNVEDGRGFNWTYIAGALFVIIGVVVIFYGYKTFSKMEEALTKIEDERYEEEQRQLERADAASEAASEAAQETQAEAVSEATKETQAER